MKLALLYQSRYGSTARYAKALAEELGCQAIPLCEASVHDVADCNGIILGTAIYANALNGRKEIAKLAPAMAGKHIAVFTVGLTSPKEEDRLRAVRRHGLPQLLAEAPAFHFRGNLELQKLGFFHRAMMKLMISQLQKQPDDKLTEDDFALLAAAERPVDYIDTRALTPLVELVRSWK